MNKLPFEIDINQTLREKDDEILGRYEEEGPWGLELSLDLHECDRKLITDAKKIKEFIKELIEFIDMKAYDKTFIMDFGDNPRVAGISAFQFIETSSITAHFANNTNSAYIDIFSCKAFRPHRAAAFTKAFFKAREMKIHVTFRE